MCSARNTCEATLTDAPRQDSLPGNDGVLPDGMTDGPLAIDAPLSPQLVASWRFDSTLADGSGNGHTAMLTNGSPSYTAGFSGNSLLIPIGQTASVIVADSPAFDIPSGRIELRYKFEVNSPAAELGLISRDAVGTATDGHISIMLTQDRRIVLRIQQMSSPPVEAYRCSAGAMASGTWHHLEAQFGPAGLVLRSDGGVASGTSWINGNNVMVSCTTPWTRGIAGNDNPIVIGALGLQSAEGTGTPVTAVAGNVAFDDIEIWANP